MNASEKGGKIMNGGSVLLECQKEFLFNCRYEPTEWSEGEDIPMYICKKGGVNIYCDISENIYVDDVINIHKKMSNEMFKVCEKCKYHN